MDYNGLPDYIHPVHASKFTYRDIAGSSPLKHLHQALIPIRGHYIIPPVIHYGLLFKDPINIENIARQFGLLRTRTINGFPTDPPPENAMNWDPISCTYDEMALKPTLDALANYFNEQNPSAFHPRVIWILSEVYPCLRITSNYSSGGEIPDDDYMSRLRDFFGLQGQPMWYLDESKFRWMKKKSKKLL